MIERGVMCDVSPIRERIRLGGEHEERERKINKQNVNRKRTSSGSRVGLVELVLDRGLEVVRGNS